MSGQTYLDSLNPQQRDAVLFTDGPSLVIAGAGSGKTRVLTFKIVHLLAHGYKPGRILALTFTNKAAREMRERIELQVGASTASKLWMGTFHSIFARILRLNAERIGYKPGYTIYDTADSKSLVKTIIKDMGLDSKIYIPANVLNVISRAKNALIEPSKYPFRAVDKDRGVPSIYEIYHAYVDRCKIANCMDFDDLLYYTYILFRDHADVLHRFQEYFQYILVDEYQDTNYAQHCIVSMLAHKHQHLCVVGDDAQSIYSFRGANISNILNLKCEYPRLQTFKLERNYRSTRNITEAANSLISRNKDQIPKRVFSENEDGARIEILKCDSDIVEGNMVANRIESLRSEQHDSYNEYAILYRTNAQSRVLEESLRKRNIPYRIYGGLSFYQRKEVKDALAYCRLSLNPDDDEALKRVINYPSRGIGDTTIAKVTRCAIDAGVSLWQVISMPETYDAGLGTALLRKLDSFVRMIRSFITLNELGNDAYIVVSKIISETQLLALEMSETTPENISRRENLEELLSGVKDFVAERTESGETDLSLATFMADVSLATDQDDDTSAEYGNRGCLTLMTVHAAKGLEFGNIFVVGVEKDFFPMYYNSQSAIEEERRLLYVAITRAKRFCMLSYVNSESIYSGRFRNGKIMECRPSPFLKDISMKYMRFWGGTTLTGLTRSIVRPNDNYRSSTIPTHRDRSSVPSAPRFMSVSSPAKSVVDTEAGLHKPCELTVGAEIRHSRFGQGTIIRIDTSGTDAKIEVEFAAGDTKTLLLKYARFVIL